MKCIILSLLMAFSFSSFAAKKSKRSKRRPASSNELLIRASYKGVEKGSLDLYMSPSYKTVTLKIDEYEIDFFCDADLDGKPEWSCGNPEQMGNITLNFKEGFKKIKILPYVIDYRELRPGSDVVSKSLKLKSQKTSVFILDKLSSASFKF